MTTTELSDTMRQLNIRLNYLDNKDDSWGVKKLLRIQLAVTRLEKENSALKDQVVRLQELLREPSPRKNPLRPNFERTY